MKKKKVSRKKEQSAETRKKLYESAEKLFNQYDFADVSVEAIAEAAGVTKGTFYVHFASKDNLYLSLFSDYTARLDLEYRTFLDSLPPEMPAADTLMAFVKEIIDLMVNRIGYENLRTVYKLQLTNNMEIICGYGRELYRTFGSVLERGMQQGEFKTSLPFETLARHCVMAIRGLTYEWCIRYPGFDLEKQTLTHFQILLEGIMASPLNETAVAGESCSTVKGR